MRSLTDLQALAQEHGISIDRTPYVGILIPEKKSRIELMDDLRAVTGDFDPDVQLDPAKAQDLKNAIDWSLKGAKRFESVEKKYGAGWVAEPKLDGARLRLFMGLEANTMNSGRRSDVTYTYIERADNFPHLRDLVVPELAGTALDGELMPPVSSLTTVSGVTTKGTLNSAMALLNVNPAASVATQEKYGPAVFMAFDVLMYQGESVMHLPLDTRRLILKGVVALINKYIGFTKVITDAGTKNNPVQILPQHPVTAQVIQGFLDEGYEGAMLKKVDAPYLPGKRMSAWQKVKTMSTGDFFIIGSVDGKGRNAGKVGSLKVAWWDGSENKPLSDMPQYCADVAGISDAFRDELTGPDGKVDSDYIGTVIEVMAQGKTKNGRLRHPHFVRLRPDKAPADCTPDCSIDLFPEV